MVSQLPMLLVTATLEATTTMFLKKWIGLAKAADLLRLNLPKKKGGLGLSAICTVYQKQQRSDASLILTSRKPVVQHIAHLTIKREQNLHRPIYRPMLEVRDIWQEDPETNKTLLKKEKIQATERESEKRLEHARSQQHQGQCVLLKTKQPAHGPLQCSSYYLKC